MFIKNMIQYMNFGDAGQCPFCGNALTVEEIETPIRKNWLIKCPECEKGEMYSGMSKETQKTLGK